MSKLYVLIHDPAGDRVASYDGMTQATITTLQSFPFDFIDQAAYDAFILTHLPIPPTAAQILAAERTQAIGELTSGTQPLTKLQRAILLVILDEINVIRGLLVPSQIARTAVQFRNAVQAKINSGAAD